MCAIVVVGGASIDYAGGGAELPSAGESVDAGRFHRGPGGKGANAAVAAARLGARVTLVSCVGADAEGDHLVSHLQASGVDTRFVRRDPREPTAATVIQVDARGRKQTLSRAGAVRRLSAGDVESAANVIGQAHVLLLQLEVPLACVTEAVRLARHAGTRVILDPAPARELPDSLLAAVDLICPNALEAEALTGIPVRDRPSALRAADRLLQRGCATAAVEAGDAGKLVKWTGGEIWLPRLQVEVVDTTGAGDAFAAAIAVRLGEGCALEDAARFANAAAALAVTGFGAQTALPERGAVSSLLQRSAPPQGPA